MQYKYDLQINILDLKLISFEQKHGYDHFP